MEHEDWFQVQVFRDNITLPPTLHRVSTHRSERQRQVPQICDIWIPFCHVSPNHFNIFFIPRVEDLFQIGDRVLKVNSGTKSRLISWRMFDDVNFGIRWQIDSTNEQSFTLLPSDVVILNLVQEGEQSNFLS
jgi:hypothetical protein